MVKARRIIVVVSKGRAARAKGSRDSAHGIGVPTPGVKQNSIDWQGNPAILGSFHPSSTRSNLMNSRAIKKLREKLARDECVYGLWVTLEAPSITEMAVAL